MKLYPRKLLIDSLCHFGLAIEHDGVTVIQEPRSHLCVESKLGVAQDKISWIISVRDQKNEFSFSYIRMLGCKEVADKRDSPLERNFLVWHRRILCTFECPRQNAKRYPSGMFFRQANGIGHFFTCQVLQLPCQLRYTASASLGKI